MIRVLHVIDGRRFGGAESVLVTLGAYAKAAGIAPRVAVLAPPAGGRDRLLPALRRAGLDPRFLGIERLGQPHAVSRVAAAIRASGCDIVHAHGVGAGTLVPVAAALARRPAVCTLHHMPEPGPDRRTALRERLAVRLASRTRGLIFVSAASRRCFAERYGADPRTWIVLPDGVDLDRFTPEQATATVPVPATATATVPAVAPAAVRAGLGLPPYAPVVAVIGHMRRGTGHDVAVDAWPAVLAAHPDARLLLVGDGPGMPALRRRAAGLGVAGRAVFAGVRDDMPDVLRACDLVLLPGNGAALPAVLVEAAACGVPAVATRVGGVPEAVADGETGWLFDPPPAGAGAGAAAGAPAPAAAGAVRAALDVRRTDSARFAAAGAAARADADAGAGADAAAGAVARAVRAALEVRRADPARFAAVGQAARARARVRFDARVWAGRLAFLYREAAAGHGLGDRLNRRPFRADPGETPP